MGMVSRFVLPIFGFVSMALLLDVKFEEIPIRKRWYGGALLLAMLVMNAWVLLVLGVEIYRTFYLIWVQLPLMLVFWIVSRYRGIRVVFILLTAITLASIPVNISLAVYTLITPSHRIRALVLCLTATLVLLCTARFLKADFNYILEYGDDLDFWKFSIIPVLYYIYGFAVSGYDFSQSFGRDRFFIQRIPDIIVFVSYLLLASFFHSAREKMLLQGEQNLLFLQLKASRQQLEELQTLEEQNRYYRHDIRHHFSLMSAYLAEGDLHALRDYLAEAQTGIDAITPARYCENDSVNLILSTFVRKAKEEAVTLEIEASLPATLPLGDTELCAILSNALENSIHATAAVPRDWDKIIRLSCSLSGGKFLLSIENPYAGEIPMANGLPQSRRAGHGFGVRSITSIVERHGGLYSFQTENHLFSLRIAL